MEQLRSLARIQEFKGKCIPFLAMHCISNGPVIAFHCSCHLLASIQADRVSDIKKFFGMMLRLWELFYYSPQKAEKLKEVQSVLNLPQLKVIKASSTRSHKRYIRAIRKELHAIILTQKETVITRHLEYNPFCQVLKESQQSLS